jgi:hypothetical protein
MMINGTANLPSRPFTPDELASYLGSDTGCEKIFLFQNAATELIARQHNFIRNKTHEVVSLDLTLPESAMWNALDSKKRNQIRYAQKHGVIVLQAMPQHLDAATQVYIEGYCAKHKQPTDTAKDQMQMLIRSGTLLVAQLQGNGPVIALTSTRDAHSAAEHARWFDAGKYCFYSANSSLLEHQKYKPNDLLIWEAALRLKKLGYHDFILGFPTLFKRGFTERRLLVDEWSKAGSKWAKAEVFFSTPKKIGSHSDCEFLAGRIFHGMSPGDKLKVSRGSDSFIFTVGEVVRAAENRASLIIVESAPDTIFPDNRSGWKLDIEGIKTT